MSFLWESNKVKELRELAHKGISHDAEERKLEEERRRKAEVFRS